MQDNIFEEIKALIADYIEVPVEKLSMDADLDIEYDMDSTEMTEFAKTIEQKYGISITKSNRQDWVCGKDIGKFILAQLVADKVSA